MKKAITLLVLLIGCAMHALSQTGQLKGTITNEHNQPVIGAKIALKQKKQYNPAYDIKH